MRIHRCKKRRKMTENDSLYYFLTLSKYYDEDMKKLTEEYSKKMVTLFEERAKECEELLTKHFKTL